MIEDKVMQFIRSNSSGVAHMDIGALRKECASSSAEMWDWAWGPTGAYNMDARSWEEPQSHEHEEGNEYYHDETWVSEANVLAKGKGKSKGKGKGKPVFYGHCYVCGQQGHSQRFCPQAKGKGKGKENAWPKGGFKGSQKGYGKGSGSYGKAMNYAGPEEASGQSGLPALMLEHSHSVDRIDNAERHSLAEGQECRMDAPWIVPVKRVSATRRSRAGFGSSDAPTFNHRTKFQSLMEAVDREDDSGNSTARGSASFNSCSRCPRPLCHDAGVNRGKPAQSKERQCVWGRERMQSVGRPLDILEKCSADLCKITQSQWAPLPKALVVDSGAGKTVLPSEWLPAHDVAESPGSRSNEYYTTADGNKVYNEGQKSVVVSCMDGSQQRAMTFQVAPVHKALGSVSQMVRNGNRVVFDTDASGKDVSFIQNKSTQERMPMRLENGVYVVDLLVAPPDYSPNRKWAQDSKDFARQG